MVQKSALELQKRELPKIHSRLANGWKVVPPDGYWSESSQTMTKLHTRFRIPPLTTKIMVQKSALELKKCEFPKIQSRLVNGWKVVSPNGYWSKSSQTMGKLRSRFRIPPMASKIMVQKICLHHLKCRNPEVRLKCYILIFILALLKI